MSRPKTFIPIHKETEAALPEVPDCHLPSTESSRPEMLHLGNIDLAFKSPIDRRLAHLLMTIQSTPPWRFHDEYDYSSSKTELEHLESLLAKAFWTAFECNDEGFFQQMAFVMKTWAEEAENPVPYDLNFLVSAYYDGLSETPTATELRRYVNWRLHKRGKPKVALQNVVAVARQQNFPLKEGKTGKRRREDLPETKSNLEPGFESGRQEAK
jgi:hypothetical protein